MGKPGRFTIAASDASKAIPTHYYYHFPLLGTNMLVTYLILFIPETSFVYRYLTQHELELKLHTQYIPIPHPLCLDVYIFKSNSIIHD